MIELTFQLHVCDTPGPSGARKVTWNLCTILWVLDSWSRNPESNFVFEFSIRHHFLALPAYPCGLGSTRSTAPPSRQCTWVACRHSPKWFHSSPAFPCWEWGFRCCAKRHRGSLSKCEILSGTRALCGCYLPKSSANMIMMLGGFEKVIERREDMIVVWHMTQVRGLMSV